VNQYQLTVLDHFFLHGESINLVPDGFNPPTQHLVVNVELDGRKIAKHILPDFMKVILEQNRLYETRF
jgi:hypothetical protein